MAFDTADDGQTISSSREYGLQMAVQKGLLGLLIHVLLLGGTLALTNV